MLEQQKKVTATNGAIFVQQTNIVLKSLTAAINAEKQALDTLLYSMRGQPSPLPVPPPEGQQTAPAPGTPAPAPGTTATAPAAPAPGPRDTVEAAVKKAEEAAQTVAAVENGGVHPRVIDG